MNNLLKRIDKEGKETKRSDKNLQEKVLQLTAEEDFGVTDIAEMLNSNDYKIYNIIQRTYKIDENKNYGKLINKTAVMPEYEYWSYDYPAILRNNDQKWDLEYYKNLTIYKNNMDWIDLFFKTDRKADQLQSELHIVLIPLNK